MDAQMGYGRLDGGGPKVSGAWRDVAGSDLRGANQITPVAREAEIPGQMMVLDKRLEECLLMLGSLEARLGPVLRNVAATEACGRGDRILGTTMGEAIFANITRAEMLSQSLSSIADRLEL